jgi:hypothetical protein
MARSCQEAGTKVEFTSPSHTRKVVREQTWGRAVRASHNSRELGALLIWGHFFLLILAAVAHPYPKQPDPRAHFFLQWTA